MLDLEKFREKLIALDESDAKSIVMIIANYVDMVKNENGNFTNEIFLDSVISLLNKIPEPDVLKEMYKKKQQEN
ncbi:MULTISPECIES: hypothetical protein [Bacillaceae]|uniref:hypothetical protein n=1 Tax=Bacillaceae TaxID=186817 RepID=UPI00047CCC8A|nr:MULTISPECIES: hypothetical protein [Bacillaceae]